MKRVKGKTKPLHQPPAELVKALAMPPKERRYSRNGNFKRPDEGKEWLAYFKELKKNKNVLHR